MSSQRQSTFSRLGIKTSDPSLKPQRSRRRRRQQKVRPFQKKSEEKEEVSINHIAFEEAPDSDSKSENSIAIDELEPAPHTFEEGGQATVDDLKQLNLGTEEDPRPVFVSALLNQKEESEYISLLHEYKDVFSWSYKEMPGLNPKVAVHHLAIRHGVRPVKQPQRRFRPELIPQIETEVNKLIEAGFLREVKYPTWIANIVPVIKKNGQLRICVDFRNLNQACPKDDFQLPITELMVDATTGYEVLSFMDGFFWIQSDTDEPKRRGTHIISYPKRPDDHLQDLRDIFKKLRRHQLKMNPLKYAFGVTSEKFLGFVVRHRGIEIDQSKIEAIINMPEPRNVRELKVFKENLHTFEDLSLI
ncbi:uncharacterized protein LOC111412525 [Olea europaea var. sylvestris]|uniref:uncharacterized protein LOC111412525 n=1 Tax=Olea europaea var. sylvestris TaxID=158386 RepID=UPI000C1CFD77|nr:uncharacterized protein LOC111412525 [Olea europaea var. sylvestris]